MYLKLIALVFLVSCASHQPGKHADVIGGEHNANVPITAWSDAEMSSDYFRVVHITFGNASDEWIRVKEVELLLDTKEKIKITLGQDLVDWRESTMQKINIDRHNSQMLWGSIAAVGMGVAVAGRGDTANIGAAVAIGSLAYSAGTDISRQIRDLNKAGALPQGHLLAPFGIAPGLVARRWIVLQTPKDFKLGLVKFRLKYEDGKVAEYEQAL